MAAKKKILKSKKVLTPKKAILIFGSHKKAKHKAKKAVASSQSGVGNIKFSTDRLTQLLSESSKQFSGIEKELDGLKGNYIAMVIGKVDHYEFVPIQVLKYFMKRKISGIFMTTNKPYDEIVGELGGETDDIFFIDAVSQMVGRSTPAAKNCAFLEGPTNLLESILEVEKRLKEHANEPSFLVIDSISTLMIYNSSKIVKKFCHTLVGKIRQTNVRCLFLAIESEENKGAVQTISQFVDHVIQI